MAHGGRGDISGSRRASPEDVEAGRLQLQYAAFASGKCISDVELRENGGVLRLFAGEGLSADWRVFEELLDEGRSREVYVLEMERRDAGRMSLGERTLKRTLMVLKLEKAEEKHRESHMERKFLVDLQQRVGKIPGFIASCFWAGVLDDRDASIWEFAQPTFGVVARRLAEKAWDANVAAALFVGCFAMAREVVEGLRRGIMFGDLHMDNVALRVPLEEFLERAHGRRTAQQVTAQQLGMVVIDLGLCAVWAGEDERVCEEVVRRRMDSVFHHITLLPTSVAYALGTSKVFESANEVAELVCGAFRRLLPLEVAVRGGLDFMADGLAVWERSTEVVLAGRGPDEVDRVEADWLARLTTWGQEKAGPLEPLSDPQEAEVADAMSAVASVGPALVGRRVVDKLKTRTASPPVQAGHAGFNGGAHPVPLRNAVCLDMAFLMVESLLAALRPFVRNAREAPEDGLAFARGNGMGVRLALGVLERSGLDQAQWPVVLVDAVRVFTVRRMRAVFEEELEVLEGRRQPRLGRTGLKRDYAQYWFRFRLGWQRQKCVVQALSYFEMGCEVALEECSSCVGSVCR